MNEYIYAINKVTRLDVLERLLINLKSAELLIDKRWVIILEDTILKRIREIKNESYTCKINGPLVA